MHHRHIPIHVLPNQKKSAHYWLFIQILLLYLFIFGLIDAVLNTTQTKYQLKQHVQTNNKSLYIWTVCHGLLNYASYTTEDLNGSICTNSDIFHSLDLSACNSASLCDCPPCFVFFFHIMTAIPCRRTQKQHDSSDFAHMTTASD